jgi:hypothetical protein
LGSNKPSKASVDVLEHKNLENTRLYIQLKKRLFKNLPNDQFITKVAHNVEEACKQIEKQDLNSSKENMAMAEKSSENENKVSDMNVSEPSKNG